MEKSRSIKILLLTVGNGINIIMNFIMMPYLARALSYHEYGTYGQVLIVTALFQVVFTFSLNQLVNLVFANKENDPKKSFSTLFYLSLIIAAIGLVIQAGTAGLISGWFGNESLQSLLLLSLPFLAGQIIYTVLYAMLIFYDKIKEASALLVVINVIRLVLVFLSIQLYHSLSMVVTALNIVSVLQVIMAFWFLPKAIKSFRFYDKKLAKQIIQSAYPLTLSGITERGIFYLDGFIISSLLSTTDYAIYRAGAFEVPFISSVYGSVSAVVLPEVARYYRENKFDKIVELKQRALVGNACLVYPVLVFLLFFGHTLLTFYLSDKYAASVPIFAIFNLALLIRVNDYQDILVVSGKTRIIFFYSLIVFIINIVLNLILVHYFGIIGGAIAFITFLFCYAALLAYKSASVVGSTVSIQFQFKKLLFILLSAVAIIQPFFWIHSICNLNIIFVAAACPLYLVAVYYFLWKRQLLSNHLIDRLIQKIKK